jgi:hypothetical protein
MNRKGSEQFGQNQRCFDRSMFLSLRHGQGKEKLKLGLGCQANFGSLEKR